MDLGLEVVAHEGAARINAMAIDLIGELRHRNVPILVDRVSACDSAIARAGAHAVRGQIALALEDSADVAVAFTATLKDWLVRQPSRTKLLIWSRTREYEISNGDVERTRQQCESLLAELRFRGDKA